MAETTETKKASATNWLALSTAIMAVLAALTTLYMGKFSSKTIIAQGQENNAWAYFQSKSIKQGQYELNLRLLEIQKLALPPGTTAVASEIDQTTLAYQDEIKRYATEKAELKKNAEAFAAQRAKSQEMGGNFGYALIFLQIALMLASISSLTKQDYLWYIALASNIGWLYFFLDAWFLF